MPTALRGKAAGTRRGDAVLVQLKVALRRYASARLVENKIALAGCPRFALPQQDPELFDFPLQLLLAPARLRQTLLESPLFLTELGLEQCELGLKFGAHMLAFRA